MALLTEQKFVLMEHREYQSTTPMLDGGISFGILCPDGLRMLWSFPWGIKAVWIALHSTPGVNRYKAEFKLCCGFVEIHFCNLLSRSKAIYNPLWVSEEEISYIQSPDIRRLCKRLNGKTVYLELRYEE